MGTQSLFVDHDPTMILPGPDAIAPDRLRMLGWSH
jgi:hypothetical protein